MPGRTLLIVENEYLVVAPTVELLREYGFNVLQSATGKEALETLKSNPAIDVIAVDIGLPGMNGNELIRHARAARPELKVLIVTGYDRSVIEIPEDGKTSYLMKPYLPGEFLDQISDLIGDSPVPSGPE